MSIETTTVSSFNGMDATTVTWIDEFCGRHEVSVGVHASGGVTLSIFAGRSSQTLHLPAEAIPELRRALEHADHVLSEQRGNNALRELRLTGPGRELANELDDLAGDIDDEDSAA